MVPLLQYWYVVVAKEGTGTFTCCPPLLGQWSLRCVWPPCSTPSFRNGRIPWPFYESTALTISFSFLHLVKLTHLSVDFSNQSPTLYIVPSLHATTHPPIQPANDPQLRIQWVSQSFSSFIYSLNNATLYRVYNCPSVYEDCLNNDLSISEYFMLPVFGQWRART